jgi:ATP-dependent RNA helicase RhlE
VARVISRSGLRATSIHADRTQEERIAALESFRRGDTSVLVATDVASRGIDVEGISHVVNLSVPFSADDYIHRGGRTARAGAAGEVVTFVSPEEERELVAIERAIGSGLPRVFLPSFDHGVHERVPPPVSRNHDRRGHGTRPGGRRRRRRPA